MRRLILIKRPRTEAKCSDCEWRFHGAEEDIPKLPTLGEMLDQFKRMRKELFDAHKCEDYPSSGSPHADHPTVKGPD